MLCPVSCPVINIFLENGTKNDKTRLTIQRNTCAILSSTNILLEVTLGATEGDNRLEHGEDRRKSGGQLFSSKTTAGIERIERIGKRLTVYVQNASRSRADRVRYSPCVMFIKRPFSLVFSQTTALTPLVFQNESHVWAERENTRFVSENNIGIIENAPKQFAQFRIAGNQPYGTRNWDPSRFSRFLAGRRSKVPVLIADR